VVDGMGWVGVGCLFVTCVWCCVFGEWGGVCRGGGGGGCVVGYGLLVVGGGGVV